MLHAVTNMVVLLAVSAAPPSNDPSWYVPRETWHASLLE